MTGNFVVLASAEMVMGWISIACTILLSIATTYISMTKVSKDDMDNRLERKAEDLMQSKISLAIQELKGQMAGPMAQMNTLIAETQKRLERGDEHFDELEKERQRLELKLRDLISDLKNWVVEHAAKQSDLKEISGRFEGLQKSVAHAMAALEHHVRDGRP